MKRFALITAICLLASVSMATFELEDPARIVEDDETALANEASDPVLTGAVKKVIVPPGADLFQPTIENNECIDFSEDLSQTTADGKTVSYTTKTYLGVIRSTLECPLTDSGSGPSLKIALIAIEQGPLVWVDASKTIDVK
jgi:hypothetical protein